MISPINNWGIVVHIMEHNRSVRYIWYCEKLVLVPYAHVPLAICNQI